MDWVTSGSSSGSKSKDNLFVDKVKIAKAEIKYGVKEDWQTYSDDISVHLTLDIGRDFQPNMYIGGNYKKDDVSGEIVGWSTAFKVKMFFDSIGLPIMLDKGKSPQSSKLPADAEQRLIGKEFLRLTYISTKTKRDGGQLWKDWQETRMPNYEVNKFKAEFKDSVGKNYVKDFKSSEESSESDSPWSSDDQFNGIPT
ncbi:MAG: hypothetical protein CMD28_02075 [Flavobacteriales bacterium]|nr:hypothetical protein [Flavobacteriales bacterium]|tara:strand:- start:354 stop:944 length:591 start_codon:yes stop_codon:yes gene_type:complete